MPWNEGDEASNHEQWFERTFREREEEFALAFGETEPEGWVQPFRWDDIIIPGGCGLTFPPHAGGGAPPIERREDWLYLTHGLAQPESPEAVHAARAAGEKRSGCGWELAITTEDPSKWAMDLLWLFMGYAWESGKQLGPGHFIPAGFHQKNGALRGYMGFANELGLKPEGVVQSFLFWPYLFSIPELATSTGAFGILVATGITTGEHELLEETSAAHVLLLLCKAGLGQRTYPDRQHVLSERPELALEWEMRIRHLDEEAVAKELRAGASRWHLARPD